MKIAISGKGGTGKTTVVGTMAREFARRGHRVVAFDADPNPTLAMTVGIDPRQAEEAPALPPDLLVPVAGPRGERVYRLTMPVPEILAQLGLRGPDGITLVIAGRVEHAARGCMCGTHAAVRAIIGALVAEPGDVVLVDMEAGLEHLSRSGGTLAHADALMVLVEPFYKSLVTGRSIASLAAELGIPQRFGVINKIRGEDDLGTLDEFCRENGLVPLGGVPWDPRLVEAESRGVAPVDFDPQAPAVVAAQALAAALLDRFAAAARS